MTGPALLVAATAVAATVVVAAAAPPVPPERPPGVAEAPVPRQPDLPPYEADIERLAELMGALAYMRDLCGGGDGPQWRDKMAELLAAEGTSNLRRDRLAGAFNRGLSGYAVSYGRCTPAAGLVIARALDEAGRLTRELANRFGG